MELDNRYVIAFGGLKNGVYEFDFPIDRALFAAYENEEVRAADCAAHVRLTRGEAQSDLDVEITGRVTVPCDRCLEDCPVPIAFSGRLAVRFSEEPLEYDGEVIWLLPGETEVDLTQYLYESVLLALPYSRVHEEGGCDPEMLRRFRIVSEEEFERIGAAAEKPADDDRWAALAALKERMEHPEAKSEPPAEEK